MEKHFKRQLLLLVANSAERSRANDATPSSFWPLLSSMLYTKAEFQGCFKFQEIAIRNSSPFSVGRIHFTSVEEVIRRGIDEPGDAMTERE